MPSSEAASAQYPRTGQYGMKKQLLDLICVSVLCIVLTLGLWPFHSPKNEVTWLRDRNGLRFGSCGTVMSAGAFAMSGASSSVEIWVQPRRIWDSGTLLAFYTPGSLDQFSLNQSQADFELQTRIQDNPPPAHTARLYTANTFRRPGRVFLTITSGQQGTTVYVNGVLARAVPQLRLSKSALNGRLVLGDSPGQPNSWSGELLGLAVYSRELTATQVRRHYETWTQGGRPEISEEEHSVALYLFGERAGHVVHDQGSSPVNLYIPEEYMVLDKIFLEPFWKEFSMSRSYWDSAFKNIVWFIPLGFCFFACLSAHKVRRAALATVILGALVSLTIEILQAYLPTRDSGTTDLVTNSLGTLIGVVACRIVSPMLAARFPWLHFLGSPRA